VSVNWVALLAKDAANTKYVVMYAIGHPLEAVRNAAADELKKRPREDYVPLLLACARFPVEFACSVLASGGMVRAQYTMDIQGLEADTQIGHADALNISADLYAPESLRSHTILGLLENPGHPVVLTNPRPYELDPARAVYPRCSPQRLWEERET